MSASPADRTPGRTPGQTPNGVLGPIKRRAQADPMVRPKARQKPRPQQFANSSASPNLQANGIRTPGPGQKQAMPQHPGRPNPAFSRPSPAPMNYSENASSGFSSRIVGEYRDYPLVMTKRALMEGFRNHVARFSSKRNVDPRNTNEFERPVRLHRRDPRAPPAGGGGVKGEDQAISGTEGIDDKEKERQDILRAEREAQRAADMALVAPAVSTGGGKKLGHFQKKTEQVYRNDKTEAQKKQSQLRYEEALPWHLEDFDNKSTWVGSYEAALSDTYAMMHQGPDGAFRVVPLQKWYKFTQKNQFKTLTIDEAETRFNKKVKEPRWFMDSEQARLQRQTELENKRAGSKLFLGKREKAGGGSGSAAPIVKHENADADDLDFIEDRFADDEEHMVFEEDDDTKEAEERIKKDQLQANVFDLKEEKEYEKQELLEKKEKEAQKKLGKSVKKALKRREKNYIYDSDSSDNPYTSQSESDDTETERLKEEEAKKEEERKKAENRNTPDREKKKSKSSGASGTNTPSGRPSKHDPLKNSTSTTNLKKRAGSPLNSEASGNESSRKKQKKKHPLTTDQPQISSTLQPPSRPESPPIPTGKDTKIPAKRRHGSGSDTEGNAGSGGDMSDGTRKKKLKLTMSSKNGSPHGSRAGSPDLTNGTKPAPGTSRAGSPGPSPPPPPPAETQTAPFPTGEEVRSKIPPTGITVGELLACFKGAVATVEQKTRFTALMRQYSRFDKTTRKLMPVDP